MGGNRPKLVGIWEMVSFDVEDQKSGERKPFYGNVPAIGYMILTAEGRMMVLVASRKREAGQTDEKQAALFRTMMSYTGLYRLEGDKFITTVDISWNESWTGPDQARFYTLDGDRLDVMTPWMPNPVNPEQIGRGILSWSRAE